MLDKNILLKLKNVTALYVEDEEDLRVTTSSVLKNFLKDLFVAKDGVEALRIFRENEDKIDLIITDVNMPKMTGLELAKKIKEINIKIPILITSAFNNSQYLLEAIDIGIDKYILKPIDIKKLIVAISQSLLYYELKELYIDKLTLLPSKNQLLKDLEKCKDSDVLLGYIHINDFTSINDLYGEEFGNEVLKELSNRMKEFFNDNFKVYKLESTNFLVREYKTLDEKKLDSIFREFNKSLYEKPIFVDNQEINLTATIGIAKSKGKDVYKLANRALYFARKNNLVIKFYTDELNIKENFEQNILWIKRLKEGIKNKNFKAYFQPIVNNQTKEIYKYEALIRYIDKDKVISPYVFLDIAKKARLFPNIIKIMLNEVFYCIKTKNKRVAINVSFSDILEEDTLNYIKEALEENKEYTNLLDFEILESEIIGDFDVLNDFINIIKKYDCKIGIDDFGSGYSNFEMLAKLDIDFLKIDSSLIKNIKDEKTKLVIGVINDFGRKIGAKTIAEFVSEEYIYDEVKKLGIDYSQGYYFSPPIPYEEI